MMINLNKVWNDNPFDYWTEEELLCMEEQGICYGKGSSSPPPPPTVTTQTQVSEFPTELRPFISDIFEKSQAVQEQRQAEGFQPELTQQLAPFTPDQQTAFEGIRQQVGQTRPLFEEATELARSSARGATDPAELAALMNPFLRNVVDIEKREAERVADVQEQQLAARAAQAGAFGGSRAGIIEAERQRNLATQLGDIESRGLALAFQDAQNRLQNQFGREASAAGQLSALGTAIPAQTFKELGALSGIGAAEQQQGQRALDIATQQAREEFGFPQQTLQDFSSILRGFPLPATTNVSRSTFSPAQPLATQLLGLGTGLAGLATSAGAFKKAGGRVGAPAPVALKNGGYVKLAGGGGLGEMMQENLPSNRVRMGKVAYQDASSLTLEEFINLYAPPFGSPEARAFRKLISDRLRSQVTSREGEAPDMDKAQRILKQPVTNTLSPSFIEESIETTRNLAIDPSMGAAPPAPADTATAAITKASTPVPSPSSGARTKPLSVVERMMGSLDKAVTGPDRGGSASSVTVPLNLGALGDTPIKPQTKDIGVADRFAIEKEMQLSGRGFPGAVPPAPELVSAQATETVSEEGGIIPKGSGIPSLGIIPKGSGIKSSGLLAKMRSQYPYSGSVTPSNLMPPPPAPAPLQSTTVTASADGTFSPASAAAAQSRKSPTVEGVQTIMNIGADENEVLASGTAPFVEDANAATVVTEEKAVAEPASAATKSSPSATAAAADPAKPDVDKRRSLTIPKYEEVTETFDIEEYNQDYEKINNTNFMEDVRTRLGDMPDLEQRKEFDAHPRIGAMLIKAAGAILSSTKGPVQAMAGGLTAIGNDLKDLATERRKYEDAARQERNQETVRKYNQEAKFYEAGEKAKSRAFQNLNNIAKTQQKYDDGQVNKARAKVAIQKDINSIITSDYNFAQKQIDRTMTKEGKVFLGELRKRREDLRKSLYGKVLGVAAASQNLLGGNQRKSINQEILRAELGLLESYRGKVIVEEGGVQKAYDIQKEIDAIKAQLGKASGGENSTDRTNPRFFGNTKTMKPPTQKGDGR